MPAYLQWLRYGWLPLLLAAALAAQSYSLLDFRPFLTAQLPLLLLGSALALGVFFKTSRVAYGSALLLIIHFAAELLPQLGQAKLFALCLGTAALNLALIGFTRDRSLLSGFGLLLGLALLGQGGALYLLWGCCSEVLSGGWQTAPLPLLDRGVRLHPAELLFAAALLLSSFRMIFRPEQATLGLLSATFLLFAAGHFSWELHTLLSIAGSLLVLLVLGSAYDLAFRDELTGIPSRRAYNRYLLTLGRRYCIAVIDIDHFKKLNDRHGHQVGDQALRMVAGRIARFGGGRAFRYGGEEFVVVMRGRDKEKAQQSLERMREKIAGQPLRLRASSRPKNAAHGRNRRGQGGGKGIKTTVSVGLASSGGKLKTPDLVLEAADRALYKAKRGGRNKVVVA